MPATKPASNVRRGSVQKIAQALRRANDEQEAVAPRTDQIPETAIVANDTIAAEEAPMGERKSPADYFESAERDAGISWVVGERAGTTPSIEVPNEAREESARQAREEDIDAIVNTVRDRV